jgi:Rdx family
MRYGSSRAEARSSRGREMQEKPRIAITYCTQCHWLLRAGWMAAGASLDVQ